MEQLFQPASGKNKSLCPARHQALEPWTPFTAQRTHKPRSGHTARQAWALCALLQWEHSRHAGKAEALMDLCSQYQHTTNPQSSSIPLLRQRADLCPMGRSPSCWLVLGNTKPRQLPTQPTHPHHNFYKINHSGTGTRLSDTEQLLCCSLSLIKHTKGSTKGFLEEPSPARCTGSRPAETQAPGAQGAPYLLYNSTTTAWRSVRLPSQHCVHTSRSKQEQGESQLS